MWDIKKDINKTIYKTETDSQIQKQTCGYQRGNVGERDKSVAQD